MRGRWRAVGREHKRGCVRLGKGDLPEADKGCLKCFAFSPHEQYDQGPTNCLEETSRDEFS